MTNLGNNTPHYSMGDPIRCVREHLEVGLPLGYETFANAIHEIEDKKYVTVHAAGRFLVVDADRFEKIEKPVEIEDVVAEQ